MARKVFISFLGTTNYTEIHYIIDGVKTLPVRFVQEALLDNICKEWSDNDKILIFYTHDSKKMNWLDNGHERIFTENEKIGLESILQKKPYAHLVEGVNIDDGFSEEEIWSIFDIVYGKLAPGDEVYFDVTHAFRSIPLFSTVLFNFAQFMKGTTLHSVHYGAFEKLGPAFRVREMPLEERVAPVINLTNLIKLQNLTQVANGFIEYGKIGKVGEILNSSTFPRKLSQTVDKLKQTIEKLEGYILTNRLKDIKEAKFIKEINDSISKIIKSDELRTAEVEILYKLQSRLSAFSENADENILAAINWAFEYDMIAQAYTMAQEYIISLVCDIFKNKNFYNNENTKDFRIFIGGVLGISKKDIEANKFENHLSHNVGLAKLLLQEDIVKSIRVGYKTIADNRNILNHAKNSDLTINHFKTQFKENFDKCINAINQC